MNNFWSYHNPVEIHFGINARKKLVDLFENKNCLIVATERGRKSFQNDIELKRLIENNQITWADSINPNPDIAQLQSLIDDCKGKHLDAIIGFGGGSAMDSAKVLSVGLAPSLKTTPLSDLISNPSLHANSEVLPLYTIPTTSGTGSEVTPFSTVWDHKLKKKYSLAGKNVFPKAAFVDPTLTKNLPMEPTINTGLDAINQAAESIWNKNASPLSISYATRALHIGLDAIQELAAGNWSDKNRSNMAECSVLAGLAISQTRTALCHSISYPLTAHFNIPHGLACAFTMPAVLRLNLQVEDGRFERLRKELNVESLEQEFDKLNSKLLVPKRVKSYIPDIERLITLVDEMHTPGRADNNLNTVDTETITEILRASWGQSPTY